MNIYSTMSTMSALAESEALKIYIALLFVIFISKCTKMRLSGQAPPRPLQEFALLTDLAIVLV